MTTITQLQQTLNVSTISYVSVVAQQYSSFAFPIIALLFAQGKNRRMFQTSYYFNFLCILNP